MIDERYFQDALLNIVVNSVDADGNRQDGRVHITPATS
jgi:hypothetical protein